MFYLEQAALGLSLSLTPFHDAHENKVEAKSTLLSFRGVTVGTISEGLGTLENTEQL